MESFEHEGNNAFAVDVIPDQQLVATNVVLQLYLAACVEVDDSLLEVCHPGGGGAVPTKQQLDAWAKYFGRKNACVAMDRVWERFARDELGLAAQVWIEVHDGDASRPAQTNWAIDARGNITLSLTLAHVDATQEALEEIADRIDRCFSEQRWRSRSHEVIEPSERALWLKDDDGELSFEYAFSIDCVDVRVPTLHGEGEESGSVAILAAYERVFGAAWAADKDARADATLREDAIGTLEQLDSLDRPNGRLCLRVTDTFPLDEEDYPRSLGLFTRDQAPSAKDARERRVSTLPDDNKSSKTKNIMYYKGDLITLYGGCLFSNNAFRGLVSDAHATVPGYNQYYVLQRGSWLQDGWPLHQCVAKPASLAEAQREQRLPIAARRIYGFMPHLGVSPALRKQLLSNGFGCMVNHNADNPNAQFVCLVGAQHKRNFCMAIEALRDISVSTEVLCDYGRLYFDDQKK